VTSIRDEGNGPSPARSAPVSTCAATQARCSTGSPISRHVAEGLTFPRSTFLTSMLGRSSRLRSRGYAGSSLQRAGHRDRRGVERLHASGRRSFGNPQSGHVLKSEMFASFKIATSAGEVRPRSRLRRDLGWRTGRGLGEREPMVLQRRKIRVGMEQDGRLQIARAQLGRSSWSPAARYSCKRSWINDPGTRLGPAMLRSLIVFCCRGGPWCWPRRCFRRHRPATHSAYEYRSLSRSRASHHRDHRPMAGPVGRRRSSDMCHPAAGLPALRASSSFVQITVVATWVLRLQFEVWP